MLTDADHERLRAYIDAYEARRLMGIESYHDPLVACALRLRYLYATKPYMFT